MNRAVRLLVAIDRVVSRPTCQEQFYFEWSYKPGMSAFQVYTEISKWYAQEEAADREKRKNLDLEAELESTRLSEESQRRTDKL